MSWVCIESINDMSGYAVVQTIGTTSVTSSTGQYAVLSRLKQLPNQSAIDS